MNTQQAVQNAIANVNVQAVTPAIAKTLEQELAETKALLAKTLAPKTAAPVPVAQTFDLTGGVAPRPRADTPKVDLLSNQVHVGNDALGRPIIVGQSKTLTEKSGKSCKPYNLGIGIRYFHPQTGALTTTWHKADTWAEGGALMVQLSAIVNSAIAAGYVTEPK